MAEIPFRFLLGYGSLCRTGIIFLGTSTWSIAKKNPEHHLLGESGDVGSESEDVEFYGQRANSSRPSLLGMRPDYRDIQGEARVLRPSVGGNAHKGWTGCDQRQSRRVEMTNLQ